MSSAENKVERQRIWVIYIISFFIIFFWAAFEQAGSSLTFIASNQTDRHFYSVGKCQLQWFRFLMEFL
jgi:POT family proton-dependent oligopeptide transporter